MALSKEQSIYSFGSIVLTNRIESNKEVFKLTINGSNLTIYDDIPPIPNQVDLLVFYQNTFTNFDRILLYGDEWVTPYNTGVDPNWILNSFSGNCDIFGFSFNNIINTNGFYSTFEDSYILNLNLCLLSSLRSSQSLTSDLMLITSLLNVSNSKLSYSSGNYFIGVNSSEIMDRSGFLIPASSKILITALETRAWSTT